MHVLFIHPEFPTQFRYIAPWLAREYGWTCTFLSRPSNAPDLAGVAQVNYDPSHGPAPGGHPCARRFEASLGHAMGVYDALKARPEIKPDLVVSHGSFGSSLFLPYLFDCPIINFFEYFYRPVGQDLGYVPGQAVTELDLLRCRADNAITLLDLENCDRAWTPTEHQRGLMPEAFRGKVEVVHDGIDTRLFRWKDEGGRMKDEGGSGTRTLPDGTVVPGGTRVVTYVTRGFERLRGFDVFMKVAKRIYEQYPDVIFAVAGSDRVCYGSGEQCGGYRSFRERVLAEGDYDLSRFRFLGVVPEEALVELYSVSDLHVYLTVPFFTSWSPLEAMSCSCVLLASDTACVREYVTHGQNGLLCDFFDVEGMARLAVEVLKDPRAYRHVAEAGRRTIEETYSVDVTLPRIKGMFEDVVAQGPRAPSVRAEMLVRPGAPKPKSVPPVLAASAADDGVDSPAPYNGAIPFTLKDEGGRMKDEKGEDRAPIHPSSFIPHPSTRTVLLCWELGGGLGHMMQMLPLAEDLARRGHRVIVALRQLERAASIFGHVGVSFLQAPAWSPSGVPIPRPDPITFTQLLMNVGFGDEGELLARAAAWHNLFRMVKPDLVVFDHAPTALLASRGLPTEPRRALIGSGFCCPPDHAETHVAEPWAVLRPQLAVLGDQQRLLDEEARLLARVNRMLGKWKQPPMERMGQLYADADENFLTTFPELDHFERGRRDACATRTTQYWGPVLSHGPRASAPDWPECDGPRVFVYLKSSPEVGDLLEKLAAAGRPTLAYIDGLSPPLRRRYETPTLRLSERPVDLAQAARECDAAILSGGHGATAEVLLAGKPVIEVPAALEQRLGAEAVKRLGAGLDAPAKEPGAIAEALETVLGDDTFANAARRFARRYERFDSQNQRTAMLARAEELLGAGVEPARSAELVTA